MSEEQSFTTAWLTTMADLDPEMAAVRRRLLNVYTKAGGIESAPLNPAAEAASVGGLMLGELIRMFGIGGRFPRRPDSPEVSAWLRIFQREIAAFVEDAETAVGIHNDV
jgi:hypothetical protein